MPRRLASLAVLALCPLLGACGQTGLRGSTAHASSAAMGAPVVAYVQHNEVFLADARGARRAVGLGGGEFVPQQLTWSRDGRYLAWLAAAGELFVEDAASGRLRTAPCPCSGVAFSGDDVATVENDGSALVTFDPSQALPFRIDTQGRLSAATPTILAEIEGRYLVTYEHSAVPSAEGGPSTFSLMTDEGTTRDLGADGGTVAVQSAAVTPDERRIAYVSIVHGGSCENSPSIALLDLADSRRQVPPMPIRSPQLSVWALRWTGARTLQAVFEAQPGCTVDGHPRPAPPPAPTLWEMRAGRWRTTGIHALDRQQVAGITATLRSGTQTAAGDTGPQTGTLVLSRPGAAAVTVSTGVSAMAMRPAAAFRPAAKGSLVDRARAHLAALAGASAPLFFTDHSIRETLGSVKTLDLTASDDFSATLQFRALDRSRYDGQVSIDRGPDGDPRAFCRGVEPPGRFHDPGHQLGRYRAYFCTSDMDFSYVFEWQHRMYVVSSKYYGGLHRAELARLVAGLAPA